MAKHAAAGCFTASSVKAGSSREMFTEGRLKERREKVASTIDGDATHQRVWLQRPSMTEVRVFSLPFIVLVCKSNWAQTATRWLRAEHFQGKSGTKWERGEEGETKQSKQKSYSAASRASRVGGQTCAVY